MHAVAERPKPAPDRMHYGWWILVAAVAIEFFGLGFGIFALTASYPYLIATFGWSRTAVVGSMTCVVTTVAVLSPLTGQLLDRYPIRRLFIGGSIIQALALLALGRMTSLGEYYAACVLLGAGMSGVSVLPNQVLVARWFRARLGLVNGVITAGTVLGGAASPMLVTTLAESVGWRTGFTLLAVVVGTVPPLVVWWLVRERPADLGLGPYGEEPGAPVLPPPPGALAAALRQPTLWGLAVAVFCASWPCYAATKHVILYLRGAGVEPLEAAATLSWMLLAASVGRLVFGVLWDYLPPRTVLLADYVLIVVGGVLVFTATAPVPRVLYIVVFGLGYGGLMPLVPLLVVAYFGRRAMGAILGCFKLSYDAAAGLAPLCTAYLFDRSGSYHGAFVLNAALPCLALVLLLVAVGAPRHLPDDV